MNNDRIAELYEGTVGDLELQQVSRRRIHWMCAQATGERVVDVGCSQGIASLLLGREGHQVLGVDCERAAIDEAERRLAEEEPEVRQRVRFVLGDARALPCDDGTVDAVLMGELLEHQVDLDGPVREAARVLGPGGRLVITTPYGLHEFHDHKDPLYLGSLLELLSTWFAITDVDMIGRYLTILTTRQSDDAGSAPQPWRDALTVAERRLAGQDVEVQRLGAVVAELRSQVHELAPEPSLRAAAEQRAARLADQLETAKKQTAELRRTVEHRDAELRRTVEHRDAELERARAQQRIASDDLARQGQQLRRTTDQLHRLLASRSFRAVQLVWRLRGSRRARRAVSGGAALTATVAALALAAGLGWVIGLAFVGGLAVVALLALAARHRRVRSRPAVPTSSAARSDRSETPAGHREIIVASPRVAVDVERQRWLAGQYRVDPRGLRVAAVMDEMSRACFAPECELLSFGMDDWRDILDSHEPHMLLVESAWSGNGGAWQYGVASYSHPHYAGLPQLSALIDWCREREIPTVFWNKEDPVHFDRFAEAAALFDHVLTTDANRIAAYEALDGGRARSVGVLPFAAQPRLHNPVGAAHPRLDAPVFAGTYYRSRHPDRQRSLEIILDAARPFGLVIYDRALGTDSAEYGFPKRFESHIKGRLPYDRVVEAYKAHKVFVNVNSVVDSPTMFSRRVFELLACGTGVVSTESEGIEATFGDLVSVVRTSAEATAALERWIHDEDYRLETTARAARLVLGEHTYRERMATIARTAGFNVDTSSAEALAVLVCLEGTASGEQLAHLAASLATQSRPPGEVVIGAAGPVDVGALQGALPTARIRVAAQPPETPLPERFRELARLATAPWVAVMEGAREYSTDHLADLHLATRYANADVLGRAPKTNGTGPSTRVPSYAHDVAVHAAVARRELVAVRGWSVQDPAVMEAWFREGVRFFHAAS